MDQKLLFLINRQWTNPSFDVFMAVMSSWDFWLIPIIGAALIALILGGFRARACVLCIALIVGIGEGTVVNPMKKTIQRPRPHQILADVRRVDLQKSKPRFLSLFKKPVVKRSTIETGRVQGRSFPSGHTMNNFSALVVLAAFYRRRGWWYLLPASVIAYSRIYVGAHWPSDVAASILVAIGYAALALAFLEFLWRKLGDRIAPKIHSSHPSLFTQTAT
jgi:undecaprenyl-diphosphatase